MNLRTSHTAPAIILFALAATATTSSCSNGPTDGTGGDASVGGTATGGSTPGGTGATSSAGGSSAGGSSAGGSAAGGASAGGSDPGAGGSTPGAGGSDPGGTGGAPASVGHRECDGSPFPAVKLTQIVNEGMNPVYVTSPPNDASRIFVVDLGGTLRIVKEDGSVVTAGSFPVDNSFQEQGFYSIAFHPNFDGDTEKRIYLDYAAPGGDSRVVETTLDGDTLDTSDFEGKTIVHQPQASQNHNGGQLQFGPDGYLYVGLGDGGNQCDVHTGSGVFFQLNDMPNNLAVDLSSALGSILRIDVDNPDTFPAGNIDAGGGNDGRILHYGLRNPWRFSFDRGTGDLWIGDVGQSAWEELNVLPAAADGSPGPSTNFGWPGLEGTHDSSASNCNQAPEPDASAMLPIHEYAQPQVQGASADDNGKSITGGYVYRGSNIPGIQGRYIYADWSSNMIWTITWDGEKACDWENISATIDPNEDLRGVTSFGEDANGELYIAVAGSAGRAVYRIDPAD